MSTITAMICHQDHLQDVTNHCAPFAGPKTASTERFESGRASGVNSWQIKPSDLILHMADPYFTRFVALLVYICVKQLI